MTSHTVTKEDLENTLHNVNVLLYAVEEVLIHAGQPLPAMKNIKTELENLRKQLDAAGLPAAVTFNAPEPAQTLLASDPSQRLRKNVCTP